MQGRGVRQQSPAPTPDSRTVKKWIMSDSDSDEDGGGAEDARVRSAKGRKFKSISPPSPGCWRVLSVSVRCEMAGSADGACGQAREEREGEASAREERT
eukprot:346656-Rhodomonas_salina.1